MGDDDLRVARLGVVAALSDGDSGLAYRLVSDLLADGVSMPTIIDEVLAPIQQESGRRWETGDASIPEEHATTAAVETVIALLAGAFDQPVEADLVVIACAEGDSHTLPARMAAALLAYDGLRTIFLGTSVPAEELSSYLETVDADALVLSCTRPANLLGARACIAAAHDAGVPVAVGGRAFDADERVWALLGADAHVARLPLLTDLLATWQPDPAVAEAAASAVPAEVGPLVDARVSVAKDVVGAVASSENLGVSGARLLASSVEELVTLVAVAQYLELPEVLVPHAEWLSGLVEQRAGTPVSSQAVLAALASAIRSVAPEASDLVETAAVSP